MIDHLSIRVADLDSSRRFFATALAPLGYTLVMDHPISGAGFGRGGQPGFFVKPGAPAPALHVAFAAPDRTAVDAFHALALQAGGRDNGAPGLRPEYHPNYYGAFVLDPDGHNVEAVCHLPA